ncbi:MAG: hypothetical protein J6T26_04865 [Firmicutes bacterium]|nr:hypothetical protein [Bacillota bacterium]
MNDNSIFGGSWILVIIILLLLFGGGFSMGGGRGEGVEAAVNAAINNQSTQAGLRDVLLASANGNLETYKAIADQNMLMQAQNNANALAAVQGFNEVQRSIQAQGAGIQEAIARLGFQMDSCCCAIKSQLLQDKYDRLYEQYRSVQVDASNAAQTQTLLATMGKWVANPAAA